MYKFGLYSYDNGWDDDTGIYNDKHVIGTMPNGTDVIDWCGLIVGSPMEYEGCIADEEWCKQAVDLMNRKDEIDGMAAEIERLKSEIAKLNDDLQAADSKE